MKVLAVLMRIEKLDHAWKWFINKPYVDRVEALGWSLYPICSMAGIASALQVCDALLLPGGYDVQSYYLKEDRNEHVTTYAQPMDHLEFQVIDAFMCNEKPILGICRGMQTLNVYAGGTLLQHIDTQTHAPKQLTQCIASAVSAKLYRKQLPSSGSRAIGRGLLYLCLQRGELCRSHGAREWSHSRCPVAPGADGRRSDPSLFSGCCLRLNLFSALPPFPNKPQHDGQRKPGAEGIHIHHSSQIAQGQCYQ